MKASKLFKTICAVGLASVFAFSLSACSSAQKKVEDIKIEGLTGGVAATVNGVEIEEDEITTYLQNNRAAQNLLEKDAWGQYLVDNDQTPESVREEIIELYVKQELTRQAAAANDIIVQPSEVDEYVGKMRDYYSTEEEWQEALAAVGTTEEKYREAVELALYDKSIRSDLIKIEKPSDEELLESAKMYSASFDGAKKSSRILFESNDETTAKEVLAKINSGELKFEDAAKEYSTDPDTSKENGDMGWDALNSVSEEYSEALETLEVDQVSGLITSESGIDIIKVTDEFIAPEEIKSISELPEEFANLIIDSLEKTKQSEAYDKWYEDYKKTAEIDIKDMPENVPYNIDLSKYTKTETSQDLPVSDATGSGDTEEPNTDAQETDAETEGEEIADDGETSDAEEAEGTEEEAPEDPEQTSAQPAEVTQ